MNWNFAIKIRISDWKGVFSTQNPIVLYIVSKQQQNENVFIYNLTDLFI